MYTWTCINLNIVEYKYTKYGALHIVSSAIVGINLNIVEYKYSKNKRQDRRIKVLI